MSKSKKKIAFIASSGGHFTQIMMLKPLMDEYDHIIITEKTDIGMGTAENEKIYYIPQINRKDSLIGLKMIRNGFSSLYIFLKEKPDVVISTGVLATIPFCLLSKMFGARLIYIESFAKVKSPTKTGRLMYKYADDFFVQWESMKNVYERAIYAGGLY